MSAITTNVPHMTPYRNRSGSSGVTAYAILDEAIIVQFSNDTAYLYGPSRPGRHHVGRMKSLAMSGRGLGGYITRFVRDKYETRL